MKYVYLTFLITFIMLRALGTQAENANLRLDHNTMERLDGLPSKAFSAMDINITDLERQRTRTYRKNEARKNRHHIAACLFQIFCCPCATALLVIEQCCGKSCHY